MSDARLIRIILLDDSFIDIPVQPRLRVSELRSLVASHVNVRDRVFFGLAYEENACQVWLNEVKRVLDYDIPKVNGRHTLLFLVKFYVESIRLLSDINALEQFYHQTKRSLFQGALECDPKLHFRLTAFVMQITFQDYIDDSIATQNLKKLNAFPTRVFTYHPSIEFCESQVLEFYRANIGTTKGEALMDFVTVLETIPSYGFHLYLVKDKNNVPCWIGVNCQGISLFDHTDKVVARKSYLWHHLNEIQNSGKKITLQVFPQLKKKGSSTSPKPSSEETSFSWWASCTHQAKAFVLLVKEHKTFFVNQESLVPIDRQEAIFNLTNRRHSFSRTSFTVHRCDIHKSLSTASLRLNNDDSLSSFNGSQLEDDEEVLTMSCEEAVARRNELIQKRSLLVESRRKKEEELRSLCQQEFELTGVMPEEFNQFISCNKKSQMKQTSFILSPGLVKRASCQDDEIHASTVARLEMEMELLRQILAVNSKKAEQTKKKEYREACRSNIKQLRILSFELKRLQHHHHSTPKSSHHQGISDVCLTHQDSFSDTNSFFNSISSSSHKDCPSSVSALTSGIEPGSSIDSLSLHTSSVSSSFIDLMTMDCKINQSDSNLPVSSHFSSRFKDHTDTISEHFVESKSLDLEREVPDTDLNNLCPLIKAGSYIGYCQNPAHAARSRYRSFMFDHQRNEPACISPTMKENGVLQSATSLFVTPSPNCPSEHPLSLPASAQIQLDNLDPQQISEPDPQTTPTSDLNSNSKMEKPRFRYGRPYTHNITS